MPALLTFFNFSLHDAAPVNTALITAGVTSAVSIALRMKHPQYPKVDKPLISFDVVVILLPGLMLGSKIGAMINPLFPPWVLLIGIVSFLSYACYLSLAKAVQIYQRENKAKMAEQNYQ